MAKIDMKKELNEFYSASAKEAAVVDVPEMNFLMADGKGDPNTSQEFKDAVEALYAVSYTLKFMVKKKGADYSVMPLEGLWWADNMADFGSGKKDNWKWTLMIMQPKQVTKERVDTAVKQVMEKKNPAALPKVRFETFLEGLSAQILHKGPYSTEAPAIAKLHSFIKDAGYSLTGKHHEIYLGDPRKSAPEKLKTILRQPMSKA